MFHQIHPLTLSACRVGRFGTSRVGFCLVGHCLVLTPVAGRSPAHRGNFASTCHCRFRQSVYDLVTHFSEKNLNNALTLARQKRVSWMRRVLKFGYFVINRLQLRLLSNLFAHTYGLMIYKTAPLTIDYL